MKPTQKPTTVVYRVALLSLVVMAAFTLLIIFGHRGHKAAAVADPLIVSARYEAPRVRASHRSIMPLSTTGYTASGAGATAANGNYVPCAAPNATWNGATQYTNGTYFLTYNASISYWGIYFVANLIGGPAPYYYVSGASTTTFPLTGWSTVSSSDAPAPTFAVYAPVTTISSADTLFSDKFTVSGVSRFGGVFSDILLSDTLTIGPRNGALQVFGDSLLSDSYSPQGVGLAAVSFSDFIFSDASSRNPSAFSPRLFADPIFSDTGGRTGKPSGSGGHSPPFTFGDTLFTDSLTTAVRSGGIRSFADTLFADAFSRGPMTRASAVFSDTIFADSSIPVQLSPALNPALVDSRDPFFILRTELQYLLSLKGNSMTLAVTTLAVLDKLAASYRINELNQMANTLNALPVLIRGGDGVSSTVYGYGADAPILTLLPAAESLILSVVPNTVLANIYKGFVQGLATFAAKQGYLSLNAYLTSLNATPYSALVHPNFALINYLYNNGQGTQLLSPGNVFAPQTLFGSATVGAGAGAVVYTDAASIPAVNVVSGTAYMSQQGYVPSKGVSLTVTTTINGTLTVTVTGNGTTAAGATVTGRTWTGTLSSLAAGSAVVLTPTVAGDRINHVTGIVGAGAATVGAFTVNSVIERVVS